MKAFRSTGFKLLALAGLSVFAGFMMVLWRNKGYFYPLLTHDYIMGGVVKHTLDMPYDEYAMSSFARNLVAAFRWVCLTVMAASALICTAALAGIRPQFVKLAKPILFAGAFAITLLLAVQVIDNRNYLLIAEYSIIIATPYMLWWVFRTGNVLALNPTLVKLTILFTFCTHGLFAIGYPFVTPAPFIDMIIHTTGVKESTAKQMLIIAGVLDFVFAGILLFTKSGSRLQQICLAYLAAWGLTTAVGRILGNYYPDLGWYNLRQFIPETLYRLPHFLVPLMLLVAGNRRRKKDNVNVVSYKVLAEV